MACPYINGKCSKFLSWLAEQSNKVAASQCTGNYGSSLKYLDFHSKLNFSGPNEVIATEAPL